MPPARPGPEHLEEAFQDLCQRHPRGVFYRKGSFIAFDQEARRQWLDEVSQRLGVPLAGLMVALLPLLEARGFRGDAPASASGRVGDMNCFRQLLGGLFLAWEALGGPSVPLEQAVGAWFPPPPLWLLGGLDQGHLSRLNPELARRAAGVAHPPGVLPARTVEQLQAQAAEALRPLLSRRHLLFWYDPQAREVFCGPPPEGGYPRAMALKQEHVRAEVDHELEALAEALTARSPHDLNALVFHMLAWIAWAEPVERQGRANPGFAPLLHFLRQLAAARARWVARRLPPGSSVTVDELTQELTTRLVLMCQADRFRQVINLNASVRAALDRDGKELLSQTIAEAQDQGQRTDAPLDWLVARFGHEQAQRLQQAGAVAEARADLVRALEAMWERLRERLMGLLEEPSPSRVRLPTELRDRLIAQAPALLVALERAGDAGLVRWYCLDALGLDAPGLAQQVKLLDQWLGDPDNRRWFDEVRAAGDLPGWRRALDEELGELLEELT